MRRRRWIRELELPARRRFLIQSAAAALAGLAGGCKSTPATSRLGVGIIGVGSLGRSDWILGTVRARPDMQLIAVADVERAHLDAVRAVDPQVAIYVDYQELLARDDIDAVYIITPHHWHALPAIHAARAGKHVYCDKPLSLTVAEGRAMVTAARDAGIVFQTGSQQRSSPEFQLACELVRNGQIGDLVEIDAVFPEGPTRAPEPALELPATLDWDRWLGPAPAVPYHQLRSHFTYRYFRDTGGGVVTDIGAHILDIVQWGLGRDDAGPTTIQGSGTFAPGNFYEEPTHVDVTFTYDTGVVVRMYTGDWNTIFRGTDGEVFVRRGEIGASRPELLDWALGTGPVVLATSSDHHGDWVDRIRDGGLPICDVEIGHRSATMCHLANIAIATGRPLTWDPIAERFVGDPAADAMLSRPSRAPYQL